MTNPRRDPPVCPVHGKPTKRSTCHQCNAAYMRGYLDEKRKTRPAQTILERARKRAQRKGIPYPLRRQDITMPDRCPVLGLPLIVGQARSAASPSLDRIDPLRGYVPGNVRIISDYANKLKGNRRLEDIRSLSLQAPTTRRADYEALVAYLEREALLVEVRQKAASEPDRDNPWQVIADFLEERFRRYQG